MITMIIAIVVSVFVGAWAGYSWGYRDGYRCRQLQEAFDQGEWDHGDRIEFEDCPYELDDELINAWQNGWMNADMSVREYEEEMIKDRLDTERAL